MCSKLEVDKKYNDSEGKKHKYVKSKYSLSKYASMPERTRGELRY